MPCAAAATCPPSHPLPPVALCARALRLPTRPYVLRLRFGQFDQPRPTVLRLIVPQATRPTPAQQRRTLRQYACTWVLAGSATVHLPEHEPFTVGPGDVFQIHGVHPRCYRVTWHGPGAECAVNLDGLSGQRLVDLGLWDTSWTRAHLGTDPALLDAFRSLWTSACDQVGRDADVLRRLIDWLGDVQAAVPDRNGATLFRRLACQRLAATPQAPPSIATVAASFGLSEPGFRRKFQRQVGIPPLRFQQQTRMRLASELLQTMPVTDVARQVGFASPASFARRFRMLYQKPPSAMRT